MMKIDPRSRFAVSILVALCLLGCSVPTPPMASTAFPSERLGSAKGWGSQQTKTQILYSTDATYAYLFTFPDVKKVSQFRLAGLASGGICTDSDGDVFFTGSNGLNGEVWEYAPGSTQLIQTLATEGDAGGCSLDPTTGDLAVSDLSSTSNPGVAIFAGAEGQPTYYTAPGFAYYSAVAFDGKGDLFVAGTSGVAKAGLMLAEMPSGSTALEPLALSKKLPAGADTMQWVGAYLAVGARQRNSIYHVHVRGSSAVVDGASHPKGIFSNWFIAGGTLISASAIKTYDINFYKYPKGRLPFETVNSRSDQRQRAVTVSAQPTARLRFAQ